jgi:hypothetical protein
VVITAITVLAFAGLWVVLPLSRRDRENLSRRDRENLSRRDRDNQARRTAPDPPPGPRSERT